jgi:hypothetical protein
MMWGRRPRGQGDYTTKATFPRKMSLRNTESWVVILVVLAMRVAKERRREFFLIAESPRSGVCSSRQGVSDDHARASGLQRAMIRALRTGFWLQLVVYQGV